MEPPEGWAFGECVVGVLYEVCLHLVVCGGACVCVCVFVCVVCVSACACARVCVCVHARTHAHMHAYMWVGAQVLCIHMCTYIYGTNRPLFCMFPQCVHVL